MIVIKLNSDPRIQNIINSIESSMNFVVMNTLLTFMENVTILKNVKNMNVDVLLGLQWEMKEKVK